MNVAYCCTKHGQVHVWRWVLDPIPPALSAHSHKTTRLHWWRFPYTCEETRCSLANAPLVLARPWRQRTLPRGTRQQTLQENFYWLLYVISRHCDWPTDWLTDRPTGWLQSAKWRYDPWRGLDGSRSSVVLLNAAFNVTMKREWSDTDRRNPKYSALWIIQGNGGEGVQG